MGHLCSVLGCTNPADFRVRVWDQFEKDGRTRVGYRLDKKVPYICLPHATTNEVMSPSLRERTSDYPMTKNWAPEPGWSVYSLLRQASAAAKQAIKFFPRKPRDGEPPRANHLRTEFRLRRLEPTERCSFEDCPFPAVFMTHKGHPADAETAPLHGVGKVCAGHACAIAETHPLTIEAGWIFFRPLISGGMNVPKALRGRVVSDHEERGVRGSYRSPVRSWEKG